MRQGKEWHDTETFTEETKVKFYKAVQLLPTGHHLKIKKKKKLKLCIAKKITP